ncbi:MAG: NAD(P)-dependent oxidoreductase, partial [Patescibacteria group bacterium]|nr:NAD(P)-dependent oxidoreductase [Patescibacteria group bacterium]
IDKSDLIVECNGNPIYATEILCKVLDADIPVVTLDAELHITAGSYLSTKGLITEAEGDQPGALAALKKDMVSMGFKPLVYGNLKGFLNLNPTPEEMKYWAKKQGISTRIVTSATDGTKIQVEQSLVANGLGAVVARQGLYGYESVDIEKDAKRLALHAKEINQPISDYLLKSSQSEGKFPKGVFITAEYDQSQASVFEYLKLGEGPFYTLVQNYFLCHLEVPKTIRQVLQDRSVLLDNSSHPTSGVCAIAKIDLEPGMPINWDNRPFHVRGEALSIKDAPNHVPIGLMNDVVIQRKVEAGQMLHFDDVEIPESKAYDAYKFTLNLVK